MKNDLTVNEALNLATKYEKQNKFYDAINIFNDLLKMYPDHKDLHFNLGILFQKLNETQKAINWFEKAIKLDPNFVIAYQNLGLIFDQLGKLNEAKNYFERVIQIEPNNVDGNYNLGIQFIKLKEYNKARLYFEKVVELNPRSEKSWNNLGSIFNKLGNFEKSINFYEKTIKLDPTNYNAHSNLGHVYKELKKYNKSLYYYKKAVELEPNLIAAHYNLGLIFNVLRKYSEAISSYKKALEVTGTLSTNSLKEQMIDKIVNTDYMHEHIYNNLGVSYSIINEIQKSKEYYEKTIKIKPNHTIALNNLGILHHHTGDFLKALNCFHKIIEFDPNNIDLFNNLTNLLSNFKINFNQNNNQQLFKKIFLFLFKNNNIYHKHISRGAILFLLETDNYTQIKTIFNSNSSLLNNKIIKEFVKDELLCLILQKSLLEGHFLEKVFTKLRFEMLTLLENSNKDFLNEYFEFIISLAEQCWLNEYVFTQSEEETIKINNLKIKIENNNEINELQIAILGCYIPLSNSKIISDKLLNYKSKNILFNDLLNVQIREPLEEIKLSKSIRSLDKITDTVSLKVRDQYEENPYPRWRYISKNNHINFIHLLNLISIPNIIEYNEHFDKPNILIAGCGTGTSCIEAEQYKNADILGVDLSLASLAYAQRKTNELGLNNIKYLHADILNLKKLDRKFDIIECAGTLHHMKDPIAGLKTLLDILEPHGYLKIGLYSETARHHIVKAREFIKDKNFKNTVEDIKACRQLLFNEKDDQLLQKTTDSSDFYSVSSIRDLMFHVQEHRFTLPQISKILKDLNLEFLGFIYPNPFMKEKFSKLFPSDKKKISLDNWHEYELRNPDTFANMYQFWVKKI